MNENSANPGMVMPVGPMYGNGGGFGGYGDNGLFWIILFFLFAWGGNGWGNGFGGGNNGTTTVVNDVQRGFDQSAVMGGLNGINTAVANGFADAEISRCNNAFNLSNQINGVAMGAAMNQAATQAGIADLKYSLGQESCNDRAAVNEALRDVIEANTNSTQRILDQMNADKIDAKNERIQELTTQINMMNLAASQNAQTAQIMADNAAQTAALENYLNPPARPAFLVANPNCCQGNFGYSSCGCGA